MQTLTGGGVFTKGNIAAINANFAQLFAGFTPGNIIYCNPGGQSVTQPQDGSVGAPYQSLAQAYGAGRNGKNDVIVLVGNGASGGTARVDASFTWAKDALHLIGICSPGVISQRARIAPSAGTTAFTPFITISGNGCIFQNVQFFMGFTTGTTAQIGMIVSGGRNVFLNCQIAGMADNESAQSATSRTLKITTTGENLFESCTIGVDTITRTQANASLEFATGVPRNVFRDCVFPFQGNAAGVLGILGTGAACMDRWQIFDRCFFINNIKSTSTIMTVLGSLTSASPGGLMLFNRCVLIGIGEYGDTNGLANSYIDGLTGVNTTSGIAVNPS